MIFAIITAGFGVQTIRINGRQFSMPEVTNATALTKYHPPQGTSTEFV